MKRPLFWCACSFMLAAAARFYAGAAAALSLTALSAVGAFVFFPALWRRTAAFALSALCAAAVCAAHDRRTVRPAAALAGTHAEVVLTVTRAESDGRRISGTGVARIALSGGGVLPAVPVRFVGYGGEAVPVGASLSLGETALSAVGASAGAVKARLAEGLLLTVALPEQRTPLAAPAHPVPAWLARVRLRVAGALGRSVSGDAEALLTALLTGDDAALSARALSDLRRSGLAHLTAVSGLHITLAAGLPLLLLGEGRRRTGLLAGLLLAAGYAALAAFSPSALRALAMAALVAAAELARRRADGLTSLSVAGALLCAANPFAVASLGFQLSFSATLGILLVSPPVRRALEQAAIARFGAVGAWKFPAASLSLSLGALVFTAPLSAAAFGFLPLLALPANLLVTAAVPWLLPAAALAACAGMAVPAAALWLAWPARLGAGFVLGVARLTAAVPFAAPPIAERWQLLLLAAFGAGCVWLCRQRPGKRPVAAFLLCAVLCAGLSGLLHGVLRHGSVDVLLFEETGGVALIRGRSAVVVGLPEGRYAVGRVRAVLERMGVRRLELVTAERAQSVRLLTEHLPAALCRTADGLLPPGAEARIPPQGAWEAAAMGLTLYLAPDGSVWLGEEKGLPGAEKYAILNTDGHSGGRAGPMRPAADVARFRMRG